MGKQLRSGGIADVLFPISMQRLIALLFGQPERRFGSSELIRLAGLGTGATHRQLQRMAGANLVSVARIGNQRHYQANPDSPIFVELVGIARKTVGLLEPLRVALLPYSAQIVAAFVFGSVARREEQAASDLDLMIVSDDLDFQTVFEALIPVERVIARVISPLLMTHAEWRRKLAMPDSFAARISDDTRLFIVGSSDALA